MQSNPSYSDLLNMSPSEDREFDELAKRAKDARAWRDLQALWAMPHPVRMAALPEAAARFVLISLAEPRNQPLVTSLFKEALGTTGIYDRLLALDDRRLHIFHAIHGDTHGMNGGFGAGAAGAMMHWARYSTCGGRIYTISDELLQLLHETKLGSDIPVSELRLPEPNIYIQLGTTRTKSPFTLHHPESGEHYLEGALVSSCHQANGSSMLEVTLTGSPLGKSDLTDDSVEWMQLYGDNQVSIADAIDRAFTVPDQLYDPAVHGERSAHFDDQVRLRAQAAATMPKLELIAKCILFINLPEAVKRDILEGTEARKVLMRSQSGAHRRRAARGVALSYDTVMVDAPPVSDQAAGHSGRTVGSHLRSGHLRSQRHGPGFSLVKVIWIRPVWVNPDAIAASGH
jgi:hypothetical protein